MTLSRWTALATFVACSTLARAADHDPGAPRVPLAAAPPQVDGVLDDPLWADALVLELKYEVRPAENGPAAVRTRVLLAYDADALYVAFDAEDPEPSKIRARLRDRDRAYDDDFVGVVLDPFDDHLRAFEFFANPLGVQMDLFQDDVAGSEDDSWDAIWDSAGQVNAKGYAVEMAIPMRALRFNGGGGEQLWGIDIIRIYPRDQRYQLAVRPRDRGRNCYLCQNIHVRGFEGITPGRNLEIVPALVESQVDARPDYGQPMQTGEVELEPSIDVRWGVTPNVMLNGTINPDFSQVEADSAQLAVNTTFALFYPEKRPFFLEGADIFSSPFNIVYTRNVAEPDYGAKVSGKAGASAFGLFATDDQRLNLIFPGSQGSDFGSYEIATQNQVARYRHDMGEGSTLGGLLTHRAGDGYENLVVGADGRWRFDTANSARFQTLRSTTEYPDQVAIDNGQPLGPFTDQATYVEYDYDTRERHFYAAYYDVGRDFRADMGFIPQVDYRKPVIGGSLVWFPKDQFFNQVQVRADWDRTEDQDGQPLEEEFEAWVFANGRHQSYLELGVVRRIDQTFEGAHFPHTFYNAYGEFTPLSWLSAGMYLRTGEAIDFANARPARTLIYEPWVTFRPGQHLNLNLSTSYHTLDVAGGQLFDAELLELRATWQFDVRSYLRLISQHVDVRRDPTLYLDPVDARVRDLANQLLFAYKINPQTVFFLGYSDGYLAIDDDRWEQQGRTFFMKMSYAWLL